MSKSGNQKIDLPTHEYPDVQAILFIVNRFAHA
jgi:hypothetical protein